MPDQAHPRGAQGRANCDFLLPVGTTSQEQVREIGTDDQHHDADRGTKQDQRGTDRPAYMFGKRQKSGIESVHIRILFVHLLRKNGSLGLGAFDRRSRVEPRDSCHGVPPFVRLVVHREWRVQIHLGPGNEDISKVERCGKHADDQVELAIEVHRAANNVRVGVEATLP